MPLLTVFADELVAAAPHSSDENSAIRAAAALLAGPNKSKNVGRQHVMGQGKGSFGGRGPGRQESRAHMLLSYTLYSDSPSFTTRTGTLPALSSWHTVTTATAGAYLKQMSTVLRPRKFVYRRLP